MEVSGYDDFCITPDLTFMEEFLTHLPGSGDSFPQTEVAHDVDTKTDTMPIPT